MTDDPDQDLFAAEFVLGTLDAADRARAQSLQLSSPAFAAMIQAWDSRMAPLMELGTGVEPPAWLMTTILAEIDGKRRESIASSDNVVLLRRQVRLWRSAAGVATTLAAMLALWAVTSPWQGGSTARGTYVAILHGSDTAPAFMVSLDMSHHRMVVIPADTRQVPGKSYELWMIGGSTGKPRSLGVLDAKSPAHPDLPSMDPTLISKATYAVTMEPEGGSPTGQPTSAPILTGQLVDVAS